MCAHSRPATAVPVTVDNFNRAETDMYFAVRRSRARFGKFSHHRDCRDRQQTVIRPNRDTLYSLGVFDLEAGPVTVTLPDAGKRFMSLMMINEDHYALEVVYGARQLTPTRREKSARAIIFAAIRTLVDPNDPQDIKQVHALQDAIKVEQPGGPGRFEVPNWDPASQNKVRDALLVLDATLPDYGAHVRPQGRGRSGAAPDRHGVRLGPQSRQGCHLSQRHADARTTARRFTG